jgi:hypothetical protein
VSGYVIEGSWLYREYSWVAKAGDFVRESPGRNHTLYSENGMKTFFWLNGPLEFLDDEDRVMSTTTRHTVRSRAYPSTSDCTSDPARREIACHHADDRLEGRQA